jgi:hypothetical protein
MTTEWLLASNADLWAVVHGGLRSRSAVNKCVPPCLQAWQDLLLNERAFYRCVGTVGGLPFGFSGLVHPPIGCQTQPHQLLQRSGDEARIERVLRQEVLDSRLERRGVLVTEQCSSQVQKQSGVFRWWDPLSGGYESELVIQWLWKLDG